MKKFYEEPKMTLASLTSNVAIAEDSQESIIDVTDPTPTVTDPVPIFGE